MKKNEPGYMSRGIGFNGLPTHEDVNELSLHLKDLRHILCISAEEFRDIDPFFRLDWTAERKNRLIGLYEEKIKMLQDEVKVIKKIKPYEKPNYESLEFRENLAKNMKAEYEVKDGHLVRNQEE